MKKFFSFVVLFALTFITTNTFAQDTSNHPMTDTSATMNNSSMSQGQQDKSKRPSPPATATATTDNGVTITIDYSQPSLKGRTIGKDVEPMKGKVWRAGANEATTFEVNKDVTINGQKLPAGKYALFMK